MSKENLDSPTNLAIDTTLQSNRQGSETYYRIAEPSNGLSMADFPLKGGLSLTYFCRDTNNNSFAIKFPRYVDSETNSNVNKPHIVDTHIEREYRILNRIKKEVGEIPGIMSLHDTVDASNFYSNKYKSKFTKALVVDWIPGEEVESHVPQRGLADSDDVHSYLYQLAKRFESLHANRILHRDLKTDNVKIEPDDTVTVLDFNSAMDASVRRGGGGNTMIGVVSKGLKKTENEYPPETAYEDQKPTPASDVYMIGKIGEYLTKGRVDGGNNVNIDTFPTRTDHPDYIVEIIKHATKEDPADRYANAGVLRRVLEGDPYDAINSIDYHTLLLLREQDGESNIIVGDREYFGRADAQKAHNLINAPQPMSAIHGYFRYEESERSWYYHDVSTNGTIITTHDGETKGVLSEETYDAAKQNGNISPNHVKGDFEINPGDRIAPASLDEVSFRVEMDFLMGAKI